MHANWVPRSPTHRDLILSRRAMRGRVTPKRPVPELKMNAWSAAQVNESAPIFCLPNELLTMIVRFSRDTNPPRRIPPGSQREVLDTDVDSTACIDETCELQLGWIYLTHVCRTLRGIALDCADLWTLIDTNVLPTDWCLEMIARSANSTLSFTRDWTMATFGLEELSPAHLAKTRKIHASDYASHAFNPNDPGFNTFISSLLYDSPYLEEFHFHVSMLEEILQRRILSLPDTLFAPEGHRTTQHLRTVSLLNVMPPLNAPFLTDLTRLSISFVDGYPDDTWDRYALPTTQLLSSLQRMPFLELLALRNCLPDRWTVEDLDTTLPLTHLKKIDAVTRNPLSLSLLLRACYTPTTTTQGSRVLQARFCVASAPAQCNVVLSALSAIFTSNSFPRSGFVHDCRGFEAVALTFNGGYGSAGRMIGSPTGNGSNAIQPCVHVEAWSSLQDDQDPQEKTIDLTIPGPQPIDRQTSSLYMCRAILDALHLPLLRSLSLTYDWGLDYRRPWTNMDIEEVRELLGRFPNLERLTCGEEMAGHLIALLSEGGSTSKVVDMSQTAAIDIDREDSFDEGTAGDTPSTPFLLELRSIRFLDVNFKTLSPLRSTLTLEDTLLKMIETRGERCTPIQHIVLDECNCDDWWMLRKKLRMMVPRVEFVPKKC